MPKIALLAIGEAGLAAARMLGDFADSVDIFETSSDGLADLVEGYESALILDTMLAGGPPGAFLEFTTEGSLGVLPPPLRHAGSAARIAVLVLEIGDDIEKALPAFVSRARQILESWLDLETCTSTASAP